MKQTRLVKILAAGFACAAGLGIALAQTTTTTTTNDPVTGTTTTQQTTTNTAGTIVTYTPDSDYFMFRTAPNVAPTRYYYTRDTAIVDPEEAYVASVSSCHMLTFLYLAGRQGFQVDSYEDEAIGRMAKDDGKRAPRSQRSQARCFRRATASRGSRCRTWWSRS